MYDNKDFDKIISQMNTKEFIKRKNSLDDSLNEEEKEIGKDIQQVEDDSKDSKDSDDEIEDLLRKSVQNLKNLKSEIM